MTDNLIQGVSVSFIEKSDLRKLAGNSNSRTGNSASNAQVANSACSGEPSLQNSLELAMQTLKHMPAHATREV